MYLEFMTVITPPQPGMIGLTTISGDVGKAIRFGQWLNGEGFARWEHAFVYLPGGNILEAEPGGALVRPLHYGDVYWCTGIYQLLPPGLTDEDFNYVAETLKGTPYSFLDYASLVLLRFHVRLPVVKNYVANTGHMLCSQMADEYYSRLGLSVFTDKRFPGDVTPAGLYRRDLELR